jgi:hypothetical protein
VGAVAGWLGNGIEHQALILDHDPAYSYDVKRTMDHRVWQRRTVLGVGFWTNIASQPAGTPDDSHDQDECLTPVLPVAGNPYVYVWDGPGFMPPSPGDTSTDYVNKLTEISMQVTRQLEGPRKVPVYTIRRKGTTSSARSLPSRECCGHASGRPGPTANR